MITTPVAGLRFGNWLYLWLIAHGRTAAGSPTVVLAVDDMRPWLDAFPDLQALTVRRDQVRFHDRREWEGDFRYQRFGVDFSREALHRFVREALAPSIPVDRSDRVVVNVRRGDYYEGDFAQRYGFDVKGYVAEALARMDHVERVIVVSDDPEWCRSQLDAVIRPLSPFVEYADKDPAGNFLTIASCRRLIGTNSTFSYWGGYVADALHEDAQIIMPLFHARLERGTDAFQLDPRWQAIDGYH